MLKRSTTLSLCLGAAAVFCGLQGAFAVGAKPGGSDWPCPQRKVEKLGAGDLQWDGPSIEGVKGWAQDPPVSSVVATLANRRVAVEEALKALKAYSDGVPAAERPKKLTLVFAGLLETVNLYRSSIISGIQKYDQRQKARAAEIEQEGLKLNELQTKAESGNDEAAKAEYAKAQELFEWNTRVFEDRRQNLPLACEIPPAIDARMFDIVREIKVLLGTTPPG